MAHQIVLCQATTSNPTISWPTRNQDRNEVTRPEIYEAGVPSSTLLSPKDEAEVGMSKRNIRQNKLRLLSNNISGDDRSQFRGTTAGVEEAKNDFTTLFKALYPNWVKAQCEEDPTIVASPEYYSTGDGHTQTLEECCAKW